MRAVFPVHGRTRRLLALVGVAVVVSVGYAVLIAIPTAIIPNPLFRRMTEPTVWSWLFWLAPSLLVGPLAATYVRQRRDGDCGLQGRVVAGGLLSYLAVGCPICNKIIVALIGVTGALTYFAPLQPVLGAASVAILGYALWLRLRARAIVLEPAT